MSIRMLHDRLLVERLESESVTEGGIIIPDQAKDRPIVGRVISAGPGTPTKKGEREPMSASAGDLVLFGKYSGMEIEYDGKKLLVLRNNDLFGVIRGG